MTTPTPIHRDEIDADSLVSTALPALEAGHLERLSFVLNQFDSLDSHIDITQDVNSDGLYHYARTKLGTDAENGYTIEQEFDEASLKSFINGFASRSSCAISDMTLIAA